MEYVIILIMMRILKMNIMSKANVCYAHQESITLKCIGLVSNRESKQLKPITSRMMRVHVKFLNFRIYLI